ncbi:MAG: M48 family metallopeptidase [Bryobacteraceae bacterium]
MAVMMLPGCAGSRRRAGEPIQPAGFNLFTPEQDIQLGREAATQVRRELPVVRDSALQGYIERVGGRLASQPGAAKFPYEFGLINDRSINAFALPGGPVFINTGLITSADNEAQLAGVMAHEIAHVALRHGTAQASRSQAIQLPAAIAGGLVGGGGSLLGQLAQLGIGLGAQSVLLSYSREAELEADALGARIMHSAGYNPLEMARFFEKLEAEGGSRAPQFLSSHPSPGNRLQQVQAEIRQLPQREYQTNISGDFKRMQQRAQQLPAPPRQSSQLLLVPVVSSVKLEKTSVEPPYAMPIQSPAISTPAAGPHRFSGLRGAQAGRAAAASAA